MDQAATLVPPARAGTFTFDDMRLQVGARMQIQIPFGSNAPQHFTTLIGFVKDDYMIVRIPFENGLSVSLPLDSTVVVRVLSGVHVFAFSSVVKRVFLAPLFYAHLSCPDTIAGTVVRQAMRAGVDIPVTVTGGGAGTSNVMARFSNISATGGFVDSPAPLGERNDTMRLTFSFRVHPGNREVTIETGATIRNVRAPVEGTEAPFGYGVSFDDLPEDRTVMIQNLVYQALAENRAV